jgi:hypothetical protein
MLTTVAVTGQFPRIRFVYSNVVYEGTFDGSTIAVDFGSGLQRDSLLFLRAGTSKCVTP